jgi:hypothetical protein
LLLLNGDGSTDPIDGGDRSIKRLLGQGHRRDQREHGASQDDPNSVGLSVSGTIEDGMVQMSAKFNEMGVEHVSGCGEGKGE